MVVTPPAVVRRELPKHLMQALDTFMRGQRTLLLTGAGVSTDSGIPDYRGPNGSFTQGHKPTTFQDFTSSHDTRQRYWARNFLGWPLFAAAVPNSTHTAITRLQRHGCLTGVLTQNVDGLHQAAGTHDVMELHGSNHSVVCLDCRTVTPRSAVQEQLVELNPSWASLRFSEWQESLGTARPDGDMDTAVDHSSFNIPSCEDCGGMLKPHVVMFGEMVPRDLVERAYHATETSDVLMAVGTSLQVFSSFRFLRHADKHRIPIVIVNMGPTRGDSLASVKMEASCGDVLQELCTVLGAVDDHPPTP